MMYVFEGGSIVYNGSTLTEDEKLQAVEVVSLPVPEVIEGKVPELRADLENQTVFYEYVDEPKETLDMQKAIAALQDENAEILFKLAMQEMGGI